MRVEEPEIAAEALAARVDLAGQRATLTRLDGRVNGGTLSGCWFSWSSYQDPCLKWI